MMGIGAAFAERLKTSGPALTVLTSLPLILFMLQHLLRWKVEANWPVVVWPALSLAGAWVIVGWGGWAGRAARWIHVAIGVVAIGLIYAQALWQPFDVPALDRTREQRGWAGLQSEIATLAAANGATWVATQGGYGARGRTLDLWADQRKRSARGPARPAKPLCLHAAAGPGSDGSGALCHGALLP